MYLVEYVTKLIYTVEDVKREILPDCKTAREFIITKQNEMVKGSDTFFLLKFKEVK